MEYIKNLLSDATAFGSVLTALLTLIGSFLIAHFTAKNEIKKSKFAAKREDKLSEDKAFQQMVTNTTLYIYDDYYDHREEALTSIAVARTYKKGYVAELIDELRNAVISGRKNEVQMKLAEVISNNCNPDDI